VLNNLFSNAFKYTKDEGEITIVCQYVEGSKLVGAVYDRASL
jgi:signal transduction histidine kinase